MVFIEWNASFPNSYLWYRSKKLCLWNNHNIVSLGSFSAMISLGLWPHGILVPKLPSEILWYYPTPWGQSTRDEKNLSIQWLYRNFGETAVAVVTVWRIECFKLHIHPLSQLLQWRYRHAQLNDARDAAMLPTMGESVPRVEEMNSLPSSVIYPWILTLIMW